MDYSYSLWKCKSWKIYVGILTKKNLHTKIILPFTPSPHKLFFPKICLFERKTKREREKRIFHPPGSPPKWQQPGQSQEPVTPTRSPFLYLAETQMQGRYPLHLKATGWPLNRKSRIAKTPTTRGHSNGGTPRSSSSTAFESSLECHPTYQNNLQVLTPRHSRS